MEKESADPLINELDWERISVSEAALLIAAEVGEWQDILIPEEELKPYLEADKVKGYDAWRPVHSWASIEPTGRLKAARDAYQLALLTAISEGRLPTKRERRDLSGQLNPKETLLHVDRLFEWCAVHGIELGDLYNDYIQGEQAIIDETLNASRLARARVTDPSLHAEYVGAIKAPDSDAFLLSILAENKELKRRLSPQVERPFVTKERNTILAILGLLAKEAGYKLEMPRKAAEQIADRAAQEGLRTLSAGAIAKHLKAAVDALEERKA